MFFDVPTLDMMIYDVLNIYSNGRTTKDNTISYDQIAFWIASKREKYLRQQLSKGQDISEYAQDLGCIRLEMADRSECCSIDIGCTFLKSVVPVPYFIGDPTRIGPLDPLSKGWQLTPYQRLIFEKYAPVWTKKFIKTFIKDFEKYIFIYYDPEYASHAKYLTHINFQAVLVDPTTASKFKNCNTGISCFDTSKDPYPISPALWNDIKKDILINELKLTEMTATDTLNDSAPDKNSVQNAK